MYITCIFDFFFNANINLHKNLLVVKYTIAHVETFECGAVRLIFTSLCTYNITVNYYFRIL